MKKFITLLSLITLFAINANGQQALVRKNELKLNVPFSVLGAPELLYERILSPSFGVGGSVQIGGGAIITALGRYYPEKKREGAGFFPEVNLLYYASKPESSLTAAGAGGAINMCITIGWYLKFLELFYTPFKRVMK